MTFVYNEQFLFLQQCYQPYSMITLPIIALEFLIFFLEDSQHLGYWLKYSLHNFFHFLRKIYIVH